MIRLIGFFLKIILSYFTKPMYIISAVTPNMDQALLHGMTGNAEVKVGKITPLQMLSKAWDNFRWNK